MRIPRGDESDKEADERLGILCLNKKIAGGEEMKKEKTKENVDLAIITEWIEFKVGKDETLRCDSCFNYLHDQKVHLYLNDDGVTANEVMCDACWKEDQKEEME